VELHSHIIVAKESEVIFYKFSWPVHFEDRGTMLFRSIDHYEYLPFAITLLPRTLESPSGASCEPQISKNARCFECHRVKGLKFTLELAMKAQRGSRGIGQCHAPATLSPGRDPTPIVQEIGWATTPVWTGTEDVARTGMRYPVRPVRSESSVTGLSAETRFHFDADVNK
jgi:hypothetical protein